MKWSDEYATGVERIDNQHKVIFKMAEDFRSAVDVGKGEGVYDVLLYSLDSYVRTHFGIEEKCMAKYNCPVADKNKEAHERFVNVLSEYEQRYKANGYAYSEARKLVDTVDNWLDNHICHIDEHLKNCVTKN